MKIENKQKILSIGLAVGITSLFGYILFRPGPLPLLLYSIWKICGKINTEQNFIKIGYAITALIVFSLSNKIFYKMLSKR